MVKESNVTLSLSKGMKQTEIGLLPEDWEVVNLNDVSKISSSKRIFESDYVPYGIPFYRGKEISLLMQNKTIDEPFYISEAKYFSLANKYGYPKNGDLLITAVGTLGNIYCINNDDKFYFKDGNLIWINNIIQNSKFLKIALDYNKQQILDNAIGSSQKALTINSLSITKIPLPPLPEQEAIAEALSNADAWIESLEQLIAKKRLIKQGAMQELLSPKEDWEVKKLGEIGNIVTGGTPSTVIKEFWGGDIPWITPTDISINKNIFSGERSITELGHKQLRQLPENSLLVTCIASIGKNAILRKRGACNQQINAIIPNENFNIEYLYYLLELNKSVLQGKAGVTATPILSKAEFSLIEFSFPTLTEQTRIAMILSDMDMELEALEGQLGKARKVKQGMMQELLTGRVRLV